MKHTSVNSLVATIRNVYEGTLDIPDGETVDIDFLIHEAWDVLTKVINILRDNDDLNKAIEECHPYTEAGPDGTFTLLDER